MDTPAFYFSAPLALAVPEDDALPRRFQGVGYSGAPVLDWGTPLVIDLATTQVEPRLQLLYQHNHEAVIGVVGESLNDGRAITLSGELLTDIDPLALQVAQKAARGVPWQLSVGLFDASHEELSARATLDINGQTLTGPLTVLRHGVVREVSIVALGADRNANAAFFASANAARGKPTSTEDHPMSDPKDQERIHALEVQVADLNSQLQAAEAARAAAEQSLAETRLSARRAEVRTLFSELGREFTDTTAAPYLALSAEAFEAIAADLRPSAKPAAHAHLFGEQATGEPASSGAVTLNMADIYAKRRVGG